jgi:TolB-like protein
MVGTNVTSGGCFSLRLVAPWRPPIPFCDRQPALAPASVAIDALLLDRGAPAVSDRTRTAEFAPKFLRALEALNWSRTRCARELGVDKSVISRWASGGAAPTEHNLTRFTAMIQQAHPRFQASAWRLDPAQFTALLQAATAASTPEAPASLSDGPSIAVLPFQNMSGDTEQEYFVDGMVEEIITALSRIRWLLVLARNSSFTYKGHAVDVKQVGRELGVRYVLEGSVRKASNRVRITGQLIDAVSGAHLWADRFDGSLDDVFELQDEVASGVAGVIEPALQAAETARSAHRPTADLAAHDLYLRAYAMVWPSARRIPEALGLMEQAIARDPRYGPALAWAAACLQRLVYDDRSEDPAADAAKGAAFARRALAVTGDDPAILTNAAVALAGFGEDIDAMMALVDRALALNPNYARGWHISGVLRSWAGQQDIAIAHAEAALRLSPRARASACPCSSSARRCFSAGASMRRCRNCAWRCRRTRRSRRRTAFSPPAMPTWVCSAKYGRSSPGCAR